MTGYHIDRAIEAPAEPPEAPTEVRREPRWRDYCTACEGYGRTKDGQHVCGRCAGSCYEKGRG